MIDIIVDYYPGWETSTTPYRLISNGRVYSSPMSSESIANHVNILLSGLD